uniref:Uncharacterized protein n=1 Tax=Rhizophora mucronata TaxID=61149 RepID=A0A2P2NZV5_RHIMU
MKEMIIVFLSYRAHNHQFFKNKQHIHN